MRRSRSGFTLMELIIVVAVVGILATIALPALKNVPRRGAEAVLKSNLHIFRDVIDQFHGDKGHYPPTLDALVEAGYLRAVPRDPITKSADTWLVVYEELDPEEGFVAWFISCRLIDRPKPIWVLARKRQLSTL